MGQVEGLMGRSHGRKESKPDQKKKNGELLKYLKTCSKTVIQAEEHRENAPMSKESKCNAGD